MVLIRSAICFRGEIRKKSILFSHKKNEEMTSVSIMFNFIFIFINVHITINNDIQLLLAGMTLKFLS